MIGHAVLWKGHDVRDGLSDVRLLDFAVAEMCATQRHPDISMSEQPGGYRYRHAVHHRVAAMRFAEVVKRDVLDAGLARSSLAVGSRARYSQPVIVWMEERSTITSTRSRASFSKARNAATSISSSKTPSGSSVSRRTTVKVGG